MSAIVLQFKPRSTQRDDYRWLAEKSAELARPLSGAKDGGSDLLSQILAALERIERRMSS